MKLVLFFTVDGQIKCGNCTFVIYNSSLYRSCHYSTCGPMCLKIDVSSSKIQQIIQDSFYGLQNLTELSLGSNSLQSLPLDPFIGLINLKILDLSGNSLTLAPYIFSGLINLATLDLSCNMINDIPDGSFAALTSLSSLDISGNQLSVLTQSTFTGLYSLASLSLGNNQLTMLPINLFAGLTNLQVLDLGANKLALALQGSMQPSIFGGLPALKELHLQFNMLQQLSETVFSNLISLNWLDLQHNSISTILPKTFSGLKALSRLDLSYNQLNGLGTFLNNVTALRELYIGNNQLTLPLKSVSGLSNLTVLHLQENQFSELPSNSFFGLRSLVWLNLAQNQLTYVSDGAFNGLNSLEILDLDYNLLTEIPKEFSSNPQILPSLVDLFLSYNLLRTLPSSSFLELNKLKKISLSYNPLLDISATAFAGTQLIQISLLSNLALELPVDFFQELEAQFTGRDLNDSCKVYISKNSCVPDSFLSPYLEICKIPK